MTSVKKYVPYIKIFFAEVVYMIMELCASYLSYPYFGNANSVWVAIITMILLGSCIGNIIGGKCLTKYDKDFTGTSFIAAALCISFALIAADSVLPKISSAISNSGVAALIGSAIIFLPSTICFGTISPQIMYIETKKENFNANNTGMIYALSTIGGLTGILIGGFVFVPIFGIKTIISICIVITIILAVLSGKDVVKNIRNIVCILLCISCVAYSSISVGTKKISWETEEFGSMFFDSKYNRITISNTYINNKPARKMEMASGFESATYLDEDKYELIFGYLFDFDRLGIQNALLPSENCLLIGGAAYQFPKYVISHYPDIRMDVVEIDEQVTELAKKYFFLQDCIDECDKEGRLTLYNADGRMFIENTDKKYDIIFNDAFTGKTPVSTMATLEFIKSVKLRLNNDGAYIMNIVDSTDESSRYFLDAECHTLMCAFKNVYVFTNPNPTSPISNFVVVASDTYCFENSDYTDFIKGIILTDNYCPVDSLISHWSK